MRERLLDRTGDRAVARRLASALRRSTRPEPVRAISTVEALATLGPDARVRWREGVARDIVSSEHGVSIILDRATVALPAEAASAIDALATGDPAAAGELVGLDPASSIVVARRLVREGILVLE